MTVTSVRKDPAALTMTIVAEFEASSDQVWQLWADPHQLEGWWGPPGYPATFTKHVLTSGSRVEWYMTGPDDDRLFGYWDIVDARAPDRLVFRGGYANEDGSANTDMPPYETRVAIAALPGGGTEMSVETVFPDRDTMERLLATGMEEGWVASLGQIDAVLAEDGGTHV